MKQCYEGLADKWLCVCVCVCVCTCTRMRSAMSNSLPPSPGELLNSGTEPTSLTPPAHPPGPPGKTDKQLQGN